MTHKKVNSVQQYATGTGTGALTLGSATTGQYRTLATAGMIAGDDCYVRIQHEINLAEWEVSLITMGVGTITRTFDAYSNSATGAIINFSAGNKLISVTPIAFEDIGEPPVLANWLQAKMTAGVSADWIWGNYTIPAPITINITANKTGWRFDGHGAVFTAGFTNTASDLITFIVPDVNTASVNGFSIANMTLDGTGAALPRKVKNCLSLSCKLSQSAIFGFEIDRVNAIGANESGIWIYGNVFEGDIVSVMCRDNDRSGLELRNPTVAAGTGIVSSIKVVAGDFRTNKYGIMTTAETTYQEMGGLHVTDSDFIANKSAGIYCFAGAAGIAGSHFENNCTSNGGETGGAIWNVFGPIKIDNCDATSATSNPQLYLVDCLGQVSQPCYLSRSYSRNTDTGVDRQYALLAGNGTLYLDQSIPITNITAPAAGAWSLIPSASMRKPRTATAATDTILDTDTDVVFDRAAGTVTVTLPNPAKYTDRFLWFKTIQAQTVVSATANVVPIIGGAAVTNILAATAGKWVKLVSRVTSWEIMAGN